MEYCAKSELHPHSGLEVLKARSGHVLVSSANQVIGANCSANPTENYTLFIGLP
jgi:hypothetical protein